MLEELITHEVTTTLYINNELQKVTLDVFGLAAYDVILGLPWLRKRNPRINWVNRILSFADQISTPKPKPTHRQSLIVDEIEINNLNSTKRSF
jgi:hypothetical protein